MKSRTSFFNLTVLKKDITRFAPLWGLYTVFMLLFLFMACASSGDAARFAADSPDIMAAMAVVNLCYAGLSALLLFGDLFKSRLCNALHAMPMCREGWFLSHLAAGMLFCLVPNAMGAVAAAVYLGQHAYLAYVWLGLMLLQYLCFFAIGAFSVQCAGSLLGAGAVYAIMNFFSLLVAWIVTSFYEPVLFGVSVDTQAILKLSPVFALTGQEFVEMSFDYDQYRAAFVGFGAEAWRYLFVAAAAGLVLLGLSVVLYRRRALESAGDFIAFRPAAPVFLVLYTLCAGAFLYVIADAIATELATVFLVIGLAVGYFTGRMLLEKRVQVFKPRSLMGFGVLVFTFFLSVSLVWLDPIGITRRVPQPEQVRSVKVSPYTSEYYFHRNSPVITEAEQIRTVTQIHQDLVDRRSDQWQNTVLRIEYTLKNGTTLERQYYMDAQSSDGQWLKGIYSAPEAVLGSADAAALAQDLQFGECYGFNEDIFPEAYEKGTFTVPDHGVKGLMEAIIADCRAGNMAQPWEYHEDEEFFASLALQFRTGGGRDVVVFESSTNTVAYLKSLAAENKAQ